jgi:hypothetical protein
MIVWKVYQSKVISLWKLDAEKIEKIRSSRFTVLVTVGSSTVRFITIEADRNSDLQNFQNRVDRLN